MSKSTHCNDVLQGTRLALRRNDDAEKRDTDGDEIIREEQVNLETVPVTSKKFGVSQTKKNPAKSDEQSYVAVQRPLRIAVEKATTTNLNASAEASNQRQDITSATTEYTGKVKRPMIDLNLSLPNENVDDNQDATKMTKFATEEDEMMICEERENARNAPVTSRNMIMTTTENSSVKCDCLTSVSVQRPEVNNALATNESTTSIEAGMTSERSADTSRDVTFLAKVNDCNSAVIDMNYDPIEDSSLPPTLRKDVAELLMYKVPGESSKLHDIWNKHELPRKGPQIMCLTGHKREDWNFATKIFDKDLNGCKGLHSTSASQDIRIKKRNEDVRSVPLKFFCDERVMSVSDVPTTKLRDDELSCLATGAEFRLHKWMAFDYDALKAIELSGQVEPNDWITDELGLPDKYIREVSLITVQGERVLNVNLTRKIHVRNCNAISVAWLFAQVLAMMIMIMILSQEFNRQCNLSDEPPHDIHKQLRYWRNDFPALKNNCLSRYVKTKVFRDKIPTDYTSANELYNAVRYFKAREKTASYNAVYVMGHSSFAKINAMTMHESIFSEDISTANEVFESQHDMDIDYVHLTERPTVNCDMIEKDQQDIMEKMASLALEEIDNPKKMIMNPCMFYSTEAEQEIVKRLSAESDASEDKELPISSRANALKNLGIANSVVELFTCWSSGTKLKKLFLLMICLISILKRPDTTARDNDSTTQGEIGLLMMKPFKAFKRHTRNLRKNLKVRKDILLMRLKLIIDDKDARSLQGRHGNGDLSQRKTALVVWINQDVGTGKIDLACRSKWDIGEKQSTYDVIWLMFEIVMYFAAEMYMTGELVVRTEQIRHKQMALSDKGEWIWMIDDMYDTKLRLEIDLMKLMTYVSCLPDNVTRFSGSRTKTCVLLFGEVSRLVNIEMCCDLTIVLEGTRNEGLGTRTLDTLNQDILSPTTWRLWKFRRKPDHYPGPIDKLYVKDVMLAIQQLTDVLWQRRFDLFLNDLHQLLDICVTDTVPLRKEPRYLTIDEKFSCNSLREAMIISYL